MDALTGLPNRRAWDSDLTSSIERARRDLVPLSIAIIDLDHFKAFNDTFGHPAGDRLLKGAAAAWLGQMRAVDGLARYGGEEFVLLFHESSADQAVEVLSRLRAVTPERPDVLRWGRVLGRQRDLRRARGSRRQRHVCRQGRRSRPGGHRRADQ